MQKIKHYAKRCQSWLRAVQNRVSWQKQETVHIGMIPLPVFGLMWLCVLSFIVLGEVPGELSVMLAVVAVLGFSCAEIGKHIPVLRYLGGPVMVTVLLPSYCVYSERMPIELENSIRAFWESTNILYLFTVAVVVGGILSMERGLLVKGFVKLFVPLAAGSVAAAIVGTLTGMELGLSAHHTFFFIVIPIMAGGLGEGAIPLTLGYAAILQTSQPELFAQVMPPIVLGNLTAVACAGVLHRLGQLNSDLSQRGQKLSAGHLKNHSTDSTPAALMESLASVGMLALSLYMVGVLVHQLTGWPAPLVMLGLAVLIKLTMTLSPRLEEGAYLMHHFFAQAVAYPILFGMGLTLTPWQALVSALAPVYLITIFVTVLTLALTGFMVGRWAGLNPIESAIINVCHSGMGSVGDMAILTSAHRMHLMPFAQLATRIGGALTIVIALMMFSVYQN
ncbi:Citrate/L-malate proton symporter [Mycoavidus cysteinexigens]|uniref:Citrate/L-malate proton symporter n=1 Tax=Mycoavidus cysteinexigens TaxID=1553431 RepID=A0A2Z6EVL3_9BURK|nr:2-hydroxycarboxylate transporter family protein [Mycoavidus cysteinexigens]BBE09436.1 Citrate/L-malate proton symporter [Mycoavidus cysteinexigens]GAM51806.1 malate Na(+) symporter [bacterium endosymbiont of Mortierella elongata FMR23-6]GLR01655.1 citrate/malate transporter [Mycoavidus cysteinexigens]